MKRLKKPLLAVSVAAVLGAGGWMAWKRAHPPPAKEQRFEDISQSDYEKWMQDLGYTE